MKGDFTRQTFRSRNHYRGVLQQQGRVQLDADWNEQVLLQAHLDRLLDEDTVGPHGAPQDAAGMAIVGSDGKPPAGPLAPEDLFLGPGRYHVHGILCENEDLVSLNAQPDLPGVTLPATDGRYVAYLDAWHQLVTAIEQSALREVALGGPDTATRTRTVWQVRLRPAADPAPPEVGSGQLRARAEASGPVSSPCDAPTGTGYRRLENQLYRVEIRKSGDPGVATFVWSRENGSVATRLLKATGNDLTLESIGRDDRLSFDQGWIEVSSPGRTLRGEPGFLGRIGSVQGDTVTVAEWSDVVPQQGDLDGEQIVRRWESGPEQIPATLDWIALESGVQVQFRGTGLRTGDHWMIPARTANLEGSPTAGLAGNVDWPQDANGPAYEPPDGIVHAYADLAGLERTGGRWTVTDRRPVFPPLTELADGLAVGYAGGDGQQVLAGEALPRPLEVSVTRRGAGVAGAVVRFEAADADGRLAGTGAGLATSTAALLDVPADAHGIARCWWWPAGDVGRPRQQVTARWLDRTGNPADPQIDFTAAFGLAAEVGFDPGGCARLSGASTVQAAVDRLAGSPVLFPAGGDGQDGPAGADLPRPVTVLVRTGCGDPVPGAVVRFSVGSGAVAADAAGLAGATTGVELSTDPAGAVDCWWRFGGETPVQALTAVLLTGGAPDPAAQPVTFVAGAAADGGAQVRGVQLTGSGAAVPNDAQVAAADLSGGLTVLLDRPPDPAVVTGKPVLSVILELPYPLSDADRVLFGDAVAGTVPVTLAATVGTNGGVTWTADAGAQTLLTGLFGVLQRSAAGDRMLCRLVLDGRVTGGAAYTQWFWLVESFVNLVLVPHRTGPLSRPSGRALVQRAIPRATLRTALRAGATVGDGPGEDAGAARRAAGNAFRGRPARHLVLVVPDAYAAPAGVIRDALATVAQVTVDLVVAADPAAEATTRLAAGDQVDGILTDDAGLPAVTALPDFPKEFTL